MAKYHLNSKGEPGICTAEKYACPLAGPAKHYDSPEQARAAYENEYATPFTQEMSHKPRDNWKSLSEKETQAVYSNYKRVLKSMRKGYSQTRAPQIRQKALAQTADRYKIPVSQVKSIAQQENEANGVEVIHDPRYLRNLKYAQKAEEVLATAKKDKEGNLVCGCGSIKDVRVRADPFKAEIYEEYDPMVSCMECYLRVAEDI